MNTDASIETQNNPILILVRGIPGGGKSYLTAKLAETLGKNTVVVVDPDAIDKTSKEYTDLVEELTAQEVNEKLHPYRFLRANAHKGIENDKIVIWNQGFMDLDGFSKTVINLTNHASEHGKELRTLVVEVEIDGDVARKRIADRVAQGGHDVPSEAMDRFITQYRSFADEGYTVVSVNGEGDTEASVAAIITALNNLKK